MPTVPFEEQTDSSISGHPKVTNENDGMNCGWAALPLVGATVAVTFKGMTLTNELRLIRQQLAQSSSIHRIRQGHQTEAKAKLADAHVLLEKAESETREGHVDEAIELADESSLSMVMAAKLTPDDAKLAAQERSQNVELRDAIRAFLLLYEDIVTRMTATGAHSSTFGADIARLNNMTSKADALIASGNQHEANVILSTAHMVVVSSLNRMLMAQTIVYDSKFGSAARKIEHELAKNLSFEKLAFVALVRLKATRKNATMTEQYVQQSRELRDAAQRQASGRGCRAALKSIQDASAHFQRALRIAGLVVSQPSEIAP